MKRLINLFVIILILSTAGLFFNSRYHIFKGFALTESKSIVKDTYYCPMHPDFTSNKPGSCAICGMTLVKKDKNAERNISAKQDRKILYYRNPMNPQVTSPVPMKDQMGMDYVTVYEEEKTSAESGVYISPEKQQLIGVKKEKVQKRRLTNQILTVGRVAYDPALFVAQEEYLQALRTKDKIGESSLTLIKEQAESLAEASKKKLTLLGMSEQEIEDLAKKGKPQGSLYLPVEEDTVWVYITIYESDIGLVKEGLPVEIEATAFPGETFKGKVVAITPVLDPMTRSIQVRAVVDNVQHKLKPDMFVNVRIDVDLGEKLAVSQEAVIDTGERQIVFAAKPNGYFQSREIKLGNKVQDFYEVLSGLSEGEEVVSSGNFFVDSESRLKSVINAEEHKHSQ